MLHTPPPVPDLRGKSLLIFDHMLASNLGHWFEDDRAVAELHAERGGETTIVCRERFPFADQLAGRGATVLPLLKMSPWDGHYGPGGGLRQEFAVTTALARHYKGILASLLAERSF